MKILFTKRLTEETLYQIKLWRWNFDTVETLKITLNDVSEIPHDADVWIASSRNSFEIIKKFIADAPKTFFCVGNWLKSEIEKLRKDIAVNSFSNMKSLATELSKQKLAKATYFCGEQHRQELESELKSLNISISKVITHQSEMTFPKLKTDYDAVFVFSPRSAESLLANNLFPAKTMFGCIGSTTADYLKTRGFDNLFIASYPDTNKLMEEFHNAKNH
ncbi:MAG: uroporphyrinogen-III synthase [Bacteroidetes bacterium]|nr:uroporphyrinogen-III synthase [Bacteroidota bacterium]